MNVTLRRAFDREIALGEALIASGDLDGAMKHLERAHVLGQSFVGPHWMAHASMLGLELRRRRFRAAWGQVLRLFLGAIGSAIGVIPVGNTGGSDISMFKRLPIAPDLQALIDGSEAESARK